MYTYPILTNEIAGTFIYTCNSPMAKSNTTTQSDSLHCRC